MDTNKTLLVQITLKEFTDIINNSVAEQIGALIGTLNQNKTPMPVKDLMSRDEVSKLLGLSLVTLCKYHKNGILRGVKIDGCKRIYYKREDVYAKLNQDST